MKRFAVLFVLLALLAVPVAVSAQYDYPMGGGNSGGGGQGTYGGGGGNSGGGSSGGNITVGGGNSGGNMGGNMSGGGGSKDVDIVDFSFQPSMVFVHAGDTVEWTNDGGANHTVTSDSGAFDSGVISPGGGFSEEFDTPGTYKYHCNIHPNMHGTILVMGS